MKRNCFQKFGIVFVIGCILLAQICCQEQLEVAKAPKSGHSAELSRSPLTESKPALAEPKPVVYSSTAAPLPQNPEPAKAKTIAQPVLRSSSATEGGANNPAPQTKGSRGAEITFEKLVHDFGEVGAGTKNSCEFKFKNTGDALLRIGKIRCPCGCTVAQLPKKEYAPGESGVVKITYSVGRYPGSTTKSCPVPSNDKKRPTVRLTIKARIAMKVEHQPTRLNFLLNKENAGCPEITLTGRDKQPFAITRFKSTGDSITADYDPSLKATKFVLKPKVDIEKLRKGLRGQIEIGLTHPECKTVSIVFDTLPEFKVDPRVVYVRDAEPRKSVTKKIWVFSNYGEDFEIESTSSNKGTVKVLTQEKVRNGYQFELQITPPASEAKRRVFTDVFSVKVKGGQQLQITCYGIYSRKPAKSSK